MSAHRTNAVVPGEAKDLRPWRPNRRRPGMPSASSVRKLGFTLIELLVVLAIIATLLSIAVPRYFAHVERAKEATLRESLNVMRESIDKYHADTGKFPEGLEELVTKRYLRKVPVDPITESAETWVAVPPPNRDSPGSASGRDQATGLYDVKSGAQGSGLDGTPYADW